MPSAHTKDRRSSSRRLSDLLRKDLRALRPGERFPSQPELARRFDVSQGTVREALSVLVHEGLLIQKKGSGTYVAEALRRPIGIVIGLDVSQPGISPFWLHTIQEFRRQFEEAGFSTRLYVGHAGPVEKTRENATSPEFWEDINAHRLAGVAVVNCPTPREWIAELGATGLPIRMMGTEWETPPVDTHARLLGAGVRHLLSRGRRRIATLDVAGRDVFPSSRYAFVREALAAARADIPPEWRVFFPFPLAGFEGFQGVQKIWQARAEKPDGLLISMDVLFPAAASALQELRLRVPEELTVVTHSVRHAPLPAIAATRLEVDPAAFAARTVALLLADMSVTPPPPPLEYLSFRLLAETGEVTQFPVAFPERRVEAQPAGGWTASQLTPDQPGST